MSASETLTLNGNHLYHLKTQESFCNLSDLHDLTLIRFTSRSSLGKPFAEEGGGWNSLYNAISGNIIFQGLT